MRVNELLDGLGARLQLVWLEAPAHAAPAPPQVQVQVQAIEWAPPDARPLHALDELVALGYCRGIVRKLDEIEALDASHTGFVNHMHTLARQFQLDAMTRIIRQGLAVG